MNFADRGSRAVVLFAFRLCRQKARKFVISLHCINNNNHARAQYDSRDITPSTNSVLC